MYYSIKILDWNLIFRLKLSCMPHVRTIISNHNKAELNSELKSSDETRKVCCNKNSCPLDRNCNVGNVMNQAKVASPESKEKYISLYNTISLYSETIFIGPHIAVSTLYVVPGEGRGTPLKKDRVPHCFFFLLYFTLFTLLTTQSITSTLHNLQQLHCTMVMKTVLGPLRFSSLMGSTVEMFAVPLCGVS